MRRQEKEITDENEIREILEAGDICRLGLCDNNIPYIVPMNYGYCDNHLYFHSARSGKKIDIIKENNQACFEIEVDTDLVEKELACDWGMTYRTVIGFGTLVEVTDSLEKKKGLCALMQQYAGQAVWEFPDRSVAKVVVFKMNIDHMTGKMSS